MSITLLDCTLRDGGHQNASSFGEEVIRDVICGLDKAGTEYIEIGFLRKENIGYGYSASDSIFDLEKRFYNEKFQAEFVVMIQQDQYPIDSLPEYSGGHIRFIRVSFHDYDKYEGIEYCKKVLEKGYYVAMNPINIAGYTDMELLHIINEANKMNINVFTAVDTFGALTKDDLLRIYMILDNNLGGNVSLGFHFHDNLQMAYTLAQTITELDNDRRNIIIDASLLGMGREPGNLCIELIMNNLNQKRIKQYDVDVVLDLIDQYIQELKVKFPWGYETVYSLSAQYKLHRSYAEYLLKNQKLKTKQIRHILSQISDDHKSKYDEEYICKLYEDYISSNIDDMEFRLKLKKEIGNKPVMLIAPGHSILGLGEDFFDDYRECFKISANFIPNLIEIDYVFCSNIKRMDQISAKLSTNKYIIGAFMRNEYPECLNLVNTNELGRFGAIFWNNCMLMLIHLLKDIGIKKMLVVGWDGFSDKNNFCDKRMESIYNYEDENNKVIQLLKSFFMELDIRFITKSIYEKAYK